MTMIVRLRRSRTALASAGLMFAGLMTGCQGGPELVRGDGTNMPVSPAPMVNSPAFTNVAAGQNLPVGTGPMMAHRAPTQPLMAGQPVMGSGGAVYPVNYGGNQPPQNIPQPTYVAAPTGPVMMPTQPQLQPQQGGQVVNVVQTPNGPQYVLSEVPSGIPATAPVNNTPPVTIAMPNNVPSMPTPNAPVPNYVAPVGHPTFVAPPPTNIPLPMLNLPTATPTASAPNFAPVEMSGARPPEALPSGVTFKPSGVTLPTNTPTNPTLGRYPGVPTSPAPIVQTGVRLPAGAKAIDDDIPDAPAFPVGK